MKAKCVICVGKYTENISWLFSIIFKVSEKIIPCQKLMTRENIWSIISCSRYYRIKINKLKTTHNLLESKTFSTNNEYILVLLLLLLILLLYSLSDDQLSAVTVFYVELYFTSRKRFPRYTAQPEDVSSEMRCDLKTLGSISYEESCFLFVR